MQLQVRCFASWLRSDDGGPTSSAATLARRTGDPASRVRVEG